MLRKYIDDSDVGDLKKIDVGDVNLLTILGCWWQTAVEQTLLISRQHFRLVINKHFVCFGAPFHPTWKFQPKNDWPKISAENGPVFGKNDISILDNWLPVYSNSNTNGYSSIRRILIGYLIGLINVFIYLKWAIISGMWNRFIPETRLSTVWIRREWPHVTPHVTWGWTWDQIFSTANQDLDQIDSIFSLTRARIDFKSILFILATHPTFVAAWNDHYDKEDG